MERLYASLRDYFLGWFRLSTIVELWVPRGSQGLVMDTGGPRSRGCSHDVGYRKRVALLEIAPKLGKPLDYGLLSLFMA